MLKRPDAKVNVDNILKLADLIEKTQDYDQRSCRACILGIAHRAGMVRRWEPTEFATLLAMSEDDVDSIIVAYPFFYQRKGYSLVEGPNPTKEEAAAMLRHLALTGEVDWSAGKKLVDNADS